MLYWITSRLQILKCWTCMHDMHVRVCLQLQHPAVMHALGDLGPQVLCRSVRMRRWLLPHVLWPLCMWQQSILQMSGIASLCPFRHAVQA